MCMHCLHAMQLWVPGGLGTGREGGGFDRVLVSSWGLGDLKPSDGFGGQGNTAGRCGLANQWR